MSGELTTVSIDIDRATIDLYAELTNDYNPLHIDPEFAAASPFGGIIAHGTMSLNLIWQAATASLGAEAIVGATLDIRFTKPVRIGDTITAGGTRDQAGTYAVWARNGDGINVIEGSLILAAGPRT